MRIWGAMIVRNAVDLVGVNLRYHVAVGVERIVVVDNGSTDGTWECLQDLARQLPLDISRDPGPFEQTRLVNAAVRRAARGGAEWVIPIDVDEFFMAPRGLATVLAGIDAPVVEVGVVNFVQRRWRTRPTPRALLTMDHTPEVPIGSVRAAALLDARRRGLVEIEWEPSVIVRPSRGIQIERGNHSAANAGGPTRRTSEIVVLHAPLRARGVLRKRLEHARRLDEAGVPEGYGWHLRGLPRRRRARRMLWRANSTWRGALSVAGVRRPLVRDTRLVDAVAPHVPSRWAGFRRPRC
jgi:glycosyltransferase involved in cell wall biosynthesis